MSATTDERRRARKVERQRERDEQLMARARENVKRLPPMTDDELDATAALLDEIRTRHAQLAVEQRAMQQQHNDEAITQQR